MKKIFVVFTSIITVITAGAQPLKSKAYKTGIYIFCGKELPKNFSYLI